jgi:hypothetical protein
MKTYLVISILCGLFWGAVAWLFLVVIAHLYFGAIAALAVGCVVYVGCFFMLMLCASAAMGDREVRQ